MQNSQVQVFASAARTTTTNSSTIQNPSARGAWLFLNITAASGTVPTLDIKLQRLAGGTWVDITGAAFAQKSGTGTDDLIVYPGKDEVANRAVNDVPGYEWRAVATIGGASPSFTFSLTGHHLI